MRLLDQVAQKPEPIVVHQSDGTEFVLPNTETLGRRLQSCYLLYVLDDDVAQTCAEIAFGAGMFGECCDIAAAPAESVWIEYEQTSRLPVLEKTGLAPVKQECPPRRVGMLVRCSDSRGRAGKINLVWENPEGLGPEVCPIEAQFDLGDQNFAAGPTSSPPRPEATQ